MTTAWRETGLRMHLFGVVAFGMFALSSPASAARFCLEGDPTSYRSLRVVSFAGPLVMRAVSSDWKSAPLRAAAWVFGQAAAQKFLLRQCPPPAQANTRIPTTEELQELLTELEQR